MTIISKTAGATVYISTTFDLLARVEVDGVNGEQANFTSIVVDAWNVKTPSTKVIDGVGLVISNVFFDTLQTDGRWHKDSTGYNFLYSVADTVLTSPGDYQFQVTYTTTGGRIEHSVFNVKAVTVTGT